MASKTTRIPIRRENSQSRIPIRRENSQSRIPIRRENSQSRLALRRENSQSSLYSGQYEERGERSRTLPRQSSRSSLRRQQSGCRKESVCQADRDVYTANKNVWQNSLRGAARSDGEKTRGRAQERSRGSRSLLEPASSRR